MKDLYGIHLWTANLATLISNMDRGTLTLLVCLCILFVTVIIVVFYYENTTVVSSKLELRLKHLPGDFDDWVVVHLSDLHNNLHGERQSKIMKHILEAKPDIIFFTGDLIDSRYQGEAHAFTLLDELAAANLAPLWYVPGNHEMRTPKRYALVKEKLKSLGMHVLQDEQCILTRGASTLRLVGLDDPMKYKKSGHENYRVTFEEKLRQVLQAPVGEGASDLSKEAYTILLSHRPDLLGIYAKADVQLVFSGHAHGGQVRLPGIKGLYAPQQGFFPKYTAGAYYEGDTTMVVSRGLGNNLAPTRFLNRAEVLVVTLKSEPNNQ